MVGAVVMSHDSSVGELSARLSRLAQGDSEGAAWIYDQFAAELFARLKRRYGYLGEAEMEDLLQDTFLLALRGQGRLLTSWSEAQDPAAVTPVGLSRYLWDLACGLASNRRRAASLRRVVSFPSGEELADAPQAEQIVVDRDTLTRLLACLRGSGTRMFLYFTLRYRDGLSPEDVAAATGWSKKATYKLRQTLNAALTRCREQLGLAS